MLEAGGLHILGTERHESRRIDNQLRGRAGRQGDPGSSQFFLSLEDDLLRIFGGERIKPWMERLGLEEGEAIEHRMITRAIENAQKKVETRNFDIRKHLLEYDNVMNRQRQAFYGKRREILHAENIHEEILEIIEGTLVAILAHYWPEKGEPDEEVLVDVAAALDAQFGVSFDPTAAPLAVDGAPARDRDALGRAILDQLLEVLEKKKAACDEIAAANVDIRYPTFVDCERDILLRIQDRQWKDHLHAMDGLREGVSLRGYANRDPKLEYQREGFNLFEEMSDRCDQEACEVVFKFVLPDAEQARASLRGAPTQTPSAPSGGGAPAPAAAAQGGKPGLPQAAPAAEAGGKVGRNDPCPCGSGKKFKKCHGAA